MREHIDIASRWFANEWVAESRAGHPRLVPLKEVHAGPMVKEMEDAVRRALGARRG